MAGVDAFDRHLGEYEAWFLKNKAAYESELNALRELLPEGKGIEVGVGSGLFAVPLGIEYGIDPSDTMVRKAIERGIKVKRAAAEALPFPDAEFDFCLMVTTVCFLDDVDLAFNEVKRVLRTGGSFVIGFVDRDSLLGQEYLAKKDKSVFYKEAAFYSAKELQRALEKAGFALFEFRQTLFAPLNEITGIEPARPGYGEGAFVVIRAKKPA